MRPLTLVAEGFSAFRERVDVDFADADFFALVGPTGAGKSTVIDAMCFALYGFVPRYGDQRLVAPVITLGAQQARVSLVFSVDGQEYVATRVVRRTPAGGATTKEARLERRCPGGESEVLAGDPRGMDAAVVDLLGLEPAHFTRCVVLPQGEFMRFLHDKPADRQQLLVRLLGLDVYGEMARRARARASEARTAAGVKHGQLAELDDANEDAEAAAAARVEALAGLRTRLDDALPEVLAARARVDEASHAAAESARVLRLLSDVRVPPGVVELGTRLAGRRTAYELAVAAEERAEAAAAVAEQACEAAGDPAPVQAALTARRHLDAAERQVPAARSAVEAALAKARDAAEALAAVDTALEAATTRERQVERAHSAHVLATSLVVGEPCPVCAVPVTALPTLAEPADLADVQAELERLRRERPTVAKAERAAGNAAAKANATLDALLHRVGACRQEVTDDRDEAALVAELEALSALAQTARERRRAAGEARHAVVAGREALKSAETAAAQLRSAYTSARDALGALKPPRPTDDVAADWVTLGAFADEQRGVVDVELRERTAARRAAERERDDLVGGLRDEVAAADIAPPGEFEQCLPAVAEALAAARAALDRVRRDRETAQRLRGEVAALESAARVADEMGRLLSATGFEAWVLQEALDELVTGASTILHELSSGAYSLGVNEQRDFVVVDHREADAVRPARTLSGGETFQASLALALALADHLGQFAVGGPAKLESIFLDEGFGTLDEDSLDVVASTLETLASGSRVVGVVTHVKELAARVPVRYEVRRVGRTATVEKVVA